MRDYEPVVGWKGINMASSPPVYRYARWAHDEIVRLEGIIDRLQVENADLRRDWGRPQRPST